MPRMPMLFVCLFILLTANPAAFSQDGKIVRVEPREQGLLPTEKIAGKVFNHAKDRFTGRVTVWFDEQFLGDGKSYERRAKEFSKWKRRDLRSAVVKTLKALNDHSYGHAREQLDKLVKAEKISNVERHWIVNGFSCNATAEGLKELESVKGVRAIFSVRGGPANSAKQQGEFFKETEQAKFDAKRYKHPWYSKSLMAQTTWKKLGITGRGTLNVVHDFNFVFNDNLTCNLYRNKKEIPGNGKDDDGNGLIDDYHGYNFAINSAKLTMQNVPANGTNPRPMHGFMCAAIICGAGVPGKEFEFGIAPEANWAGVIAGSRIEAAVEWAIEQGADTYSMSFSAPNLGEYRSHWRKLMEHGSFCGVCFVSGAGNFAQSAKIPVQMRIPEDIPNAVFAATGVQRNLSRTPFASMGPVEWETEFYKDGLVDKPELCAFNMGLPLLKLDGTVIPSKINGNSFAGPMFAGSIALMLSADPDVLPWDLREIAIATATDIAKKGYDHQTGHGLINCYRAVKEVLRRKALREGSDAKKYEGREPGDELDVKTVSKNLTERIRVQQVQPNGQADQQGVKKGDILLRYNGIAVTSQTALIQALRKAKDAGLKEVPVVFQRDGKEIATTFTPGPFGFVPAIEPSQPVFE